MVNFVFQWIQCVHCTWSVNWTVTSQVFPIGPTTTHSWSSRTCTDQYAFKPYFIIPTLRIHSPLSSLFFPLSSIICQTRTLFSKLFCWWMQLVHRANTGMLLFNVILALGKKHVHGWRWWVCHGCGCVLTIYALIVVVYARIIAIRERTSRSVSATRKSESTLKKKSACLCHALCFAAKPRANVATPKPKKPISKASRGNLQNLKNDVWNCHHLRTSLADNQLCTVVGVTDPTPFPVRGLLLSPSISFVAMPFLVRVYTIT